MKALIFIYVASVLDSGWKTLNIQSVKAGI